MVVQDIVNSILTFHASLPVTVSALERKQFMKLFEDSCVTHTSGHTKICLCLLCCMGHVTSCYDVANCRPPVERKFNSNFLIRPGSALQHKPGGWSRLRSALRMKSHVSSASVISSPSDLVTRRYGRMTFLAGCALFNNTHYTARSCLLSCIRTVL